MRVSARSIFSGRGRLLIPLIRRRLPVFCGAIFFTAVLFSFAYAQDPPDDAAPPPLKMLSKSERSQLNDKTEPKERAVLAIQLMDARLKAAEKFRVDENYSLMYDELGGFHALMDNTLDFLLQARSNEGKRLGSLKRFEIGLREFVPRVEGLLRESPTNFEPYVKKLLKYIDDAREKAIAPFFSNTVVQDF